MKNFKFVLLLVAMFVASTAMAKDIWEIQISCSPDGKLGDHSKLIKSILKENVKGYDDYDVKEKTKTLIIRFDYDKTDPTTIVNVLNEKDPTLRASLSTSVQPISLSLEKAQEKFEDAKKDRSKALDKLKNECNDYDDAYKKLMDEIEKASQRGYIQQSEIVRTKIEIKEETVK